MLFGSNVFSAPVNTCGFTDVNVLGVVDGYLYGPACSGTTPLAPGAQGSISFSMCVWRAPAFLRRCARASFSPPPPPSRLCSTIPSEGQGLGQLNILVNTTDQQNAPSWCANLTLTL